MDQLERVGKYAENGVVADLHQGIVHWAHVQDMGGVIHWGLTSRALVAKAGRIVTAQTVPVEGTVNVVRLREDGEPSGALAEQAGAFDPRSIGRAGGELDLLERMDGLTFEAHLFPFGSVDFIEQLTHLASEKFHREMFQASIRTAEHDGGACVKLVELDVQTTERGEGVSEHKRGVLVHHGNVLVRV